MKTNECRKKKEYIAPKMEVLVMACNSNFLLQNSCQGESCYAEEKRTMILE